jgi:hypothetical protein
MDGLAPNHRDQLGVGHHQPATLRPDFLVISPPKTGSSWLAANLRCHPEVFIPEIKEIKYFSSLVKWLDLGWYLDHFSAAAGRVKGEASPSYSILPVERIRLIRALMRDVKLIFLMRDPVSRAWSHAKHTYRFREANFAKFDGAFEEITDAEWAENFCHDWPLASGDYLGQLRRWLSVFPRQQLYLGFYESIVACPERLLRDIFVFLGVDPNVDFSSFRLGETILPGLTREIPPPFKTFLQHLLCDRAWELSSFLHKQFKLRLPPEWRDSLVTASNPLASVLSRQVDDDYLSRLLEHEEAFPRRILEGYNGHDIILFRGRVYAFAQALGPVRLEKMSEGDIQCCLSRGTCFLASSVADAKRQVEQHVSRDSAHSPPPGEELVIRPDELIP